MNWNNGFLSRIINNSKYVAYSNIFMMSGCRDVQTSADAYNTITKQDVGAFTNALLETLRANSHNVGLLKLYSDVCSFLKQTGFTQIPVLSSTVLNPSYQFVRASPPSSLYQSFNSTLMSNSIASKDIVPSVFGMTSNTSLRGRMSFLISTTASISK